jgi:hypothetical protein
MAEKRRKGVGAISKVAVICGGGAAQRWALACCTGMWRRAWAALCLAGLILPSCSRTSEGSSKLASDPALPCQPYQLLFAPPDELMFTHHVDVVRSTRIRREPVVSKISRLGLGPPPETTKRVSETIRRSEQVVLRRTSEGYVMTTTPERVVVLRDSEPAGAMAHLPLEAALVYRLDANGRVLSIEGFQGIASRMLQAARTDEERELAARATERDFEIARELEWGELIGIASKPRGCMGEAHLTQAQLRLPGGPIRYYRAVRATRFVDCELSGKCLAIEQRYDDSRMKIDGWIDDFWVKRGHAMDEPFVTGSSNVVLDPATMRVAGAEAERELNVVRSSPGERVTTTTYEELRHAFIYEQQRTQISKSQ